MIPGELITAVISELAAPYGVEVSVDYQRGVPPVINDPASGSQYVRVTDANEIQGQPVPTSSAVTLAGGVDPGIPDARTEPHDWNDRLTLSDKVAVTLVPSYHWSARGAFDRRMALWCSYILETPAAKIFHIGDTGYHDGSLYRELGSQHGPFDLAVLPIGAYEPRWFMSDNHMNPDEAVKVMLALGARQAIGHHWGTFQLTDEGVERPPEALKAALAEAGLPEERFRPMRPGLSWSA